ncbi:MAG: peptidoglycan DD-metalloendopeptidase family protein, partial [Mycobacteriales bacterium]
GLPVLAAGNGIVGYAGSLAGRGVVTVLHAGGLRTTYEPVVASVHPGDRVARGGVLGVLAAGHPGCPVAACLHWGLLRGETYLDPLSLLGDGQVRLLPLATAAPRWKEPMGVAGVATASVLPVLFVVRRRKVRGRTRGPPEPAPWSAPASADRPFSRAVG